MALALAPSRMLCRAERTLFTIISSPLRRGAIFARNCRKLYAVFNCGIGTGNLWKSILAINSLSSGGGGGVNTENAQHGLTPRERECLALIAQGHRVAHIAHQLGVASVTVEFHLKHARTKLDARTLPHAVALALASGLIGGAVPVGEAMTEGVA